MYSPIRACVFSLFNMFIMLLCFNTIQADDKPYSSTLVDCSHESVDHLGVAPAGGTVSSSTHGSGGSIDYQHYRVGDFSLTHTIANTPEHIGLTPGLYISHWDLSGYQTLRIWARCRDANDRMIRFVLMDHSGSKAALSDPALPTDDAWHELRFDLSSLDTNDAFNLSRVVAIQTSESLPPGIQIWFDGAAFYGDKAAPLGITDMTYEQRMSEVEHSCKQRVESAYQKAADRNLTDSHLLIAFAKLWQNKDLDDTNAHLLEVFTTDDADVIRQYDVHNDWSLWLTPLMYRLYFNFSSQSNIKPGRLYPETEEALLALLWKRTSKKNDIAIARKSSWWMIGSENHDINAKVSSLLTSQIFMNHPDYASRVYPDLGKGGGSGYWFHSLYGPGRYEGPEGDADWGDGGKYNAADHHVAWVAFWKTYIRERAKKGFFLEVASPGYMTYTLTFLQDLYDYSDDPELRYLAGQFLDLVWLEWSQDQIGSVRGGAKTRWRRDMRHDAMFLASRFYLGGKGDADGLLYSILASDYRWPSTVWKMALDRQGKGTFAYISRKPGEEPLAWPRPAGLERTMNCDTESRFVRYSWVTPDYILGTQMDHPAAIHSHLSCQMRWQGITFAGDGKDWIAPCGIDIDNSGLWSYSRDSTYYRSLQHKNVLITQQARRISQQNPDWYPEKSMSTPNYGVRIGAQDGLVLEKDRWIIVDRGSTYVGIRPVRAAYVYSHDTWTRSGTDSPYLEEHQEQYTWGPQREFIRLADPYSPLIIQVGRKDTFATLDDFIAYLGQSKLQLRATVVPGWFILEYQPAGVDKPSMEFNAANSAIPLLNGNPIDYTPPAVMNSPFIYADYGSGVIEIQAEDSGAPQVIDFTRSESGIPSHGH